MQFNKLPSPPGDYSWVAVEAFHLKAPLKIDEVLDKLQRIAKTDKVALQITEAKNISGPRHAFHAANLAMTARSEKRARANRVEIELLLYLTGRRQIEEAIRAAGVKKGTKEIAVLGLGPSKKVVQGAVSEVGRTLNGEPDDELLELSKAKRSSLQKLFDISDDELALVTRDGDWKDGMLKCVMERGAMLDALKK